MFGFSYGQLFLTVGAAAVLIGPKDLPRIARALGRFAGRSIGYVQMIRGQFDNVMQQSQASQVHKELQDTLAQLEAIRYEVRSLSMMNPTPFTRRFDGSVPPVNTSDGTTAINKPEEQSTPTMNYPKKELAAAGTISSTLHSQAMAYPRLAEVPNMKSNLIENNNGPVKPGEEMSVDLHVLPVSAKEAGFLPKLADEPTGSDIALEAILEAEVARKAKQFFSQPENQVPKDNQKE